MDIHKPKPWHGWPEFVKEIGTIVIGVLIALGAEQAVEAAHWHQKVAVVRSALQGELANDRARWETDLMQIGCISREIDAFERWESAGSRGALPASPIMADGTLLWMHNANWSLATASQSLDHFPMKEQLTYAAMYGGIANRQVYIEKAANSFDRINSLKGARNDPAINSQLKVAMGDLKEQLGNLAGNDGYMRRHFDDLGVHPDPSDFNTDLRRDPVSSCFSTISSSKPR